MPGRGKPDEAYTPQEMLERVENLQRTLDEIQPKVAAGETDRDEAVTHALSGLRELTGVVEGLVKDLKKRRW